MLVEPVLPEQQDGLVDQVGAAVDQTHQALAALAALAALWALGAAEAVQDLLLVVQAEQAALALF
jgi:hypothetical protein